LAQVTGGVMNNRQISFLLWFEPFDLWRIRRSIRKMAGEGFELDFVTPPSFKKQRITLLFAQKADPEYVEVKFLFGSRKADIENYTILWTVVSDYLWIPFGCFYFLKRKLYNNALSGGRPKTWRQ
jgi:hypothetical protein